jgi:hypothetical protein
MARRILSRINSAHVIATIALFAALGGGYAMAFSGSGSLQKAGEVGIAGSSGGATVDEVRTLTGIGAIGAGCDTTSSGDILIYMRNSSGVPLYVFGTDPAAPGLPAFVPADNDYRAIDAVTTGTDSIDLHVVQNDGTKRPQAHIQIATVKTGLCSESSVQVLALNTQQP